MREAGHTPLFLDKVDDILYLAGGNWILELQNFFLDYLKRYQPYNSDWSYEDGCVLLGAIELYRVTGNATYRGFVLQYLNRFVNDDGSITNYEQEQYNIDSINTGKTLFFALDETGKDCYQKAIEFHMQRLRDHPRCRCGNFWHKSIYPNQIWLDGLYMAQPLYMAYEMRFGSMVNVCDIIQQFQNVRHYLFCENTQLYYHAYDEARIQQWANPVTGCSSNHWLRSIGWLLMALVDCLGLLDKRLITHYQTLKALFLEAISGILPYRDSRTGLFLQVVNHPEAIDNYAETSGTAMVAYALMKGVAIGVLNEERYLHIGRDMFDKLVRQKLVIKSDGTTQLIDICKTAGLGPGATRDGSVAYYISEERVANDSKGVGSFMMAAAQWLATARKD